MELGKTERGTMIYLAHVNPKRWLWFLKWGSFFNGDEDTLKNICENNFSNNL